MIASPIGQIARVHTQWSVHMRPKYLKLRHRTLVQMDVVYTLAQGCRSGMPSEDLTNNGLREDVLTVGARGIFPMVHSYSIAVVLQNESLTSEIGNIGVYYKYYEIDFFFITIVKKKMLPFLQTNTSTHTCLTILHIRVKFSN